MSINIIFQVLAQLFGFFKAKNPVVAAIILGALSMILLNLNGIVQYFGVTSQAIIDIIKYLNVFLLAVTGTPTTKFLTKSK